MLTRLALALMRHLGVWPLWALRALGAMLGTVLFVLAGSRRRVALKNLQMCFPEKSNWSRLHLGWRHFVRFTQAWLDRAWLWHGSEESMRARLRLAGQTQELSGSDPVVIFAPHFVGMDAGGMALMLLLPRRLTSIFTNQSNQAVNDWIKAGRMRLGNLRLFDREDGVKAIVASLRQGEPLYLLPDMNFGPAESIFVPFYGHPAATVPSLSRFAKLGRAKVVPVISRMTRHGYDIEIGAAWQHFPTDDVTHDTATMNQHLQDWINTMPEQYYWVHKRFKTRPPGAPPVY
jgi:KDO2-lipid IV(A) lauroyltransferase